jgi:hypothetical protein
MRDIPASGSETGRSEAHEDGRVRHGAARQGQGERRGVTLSCSLSKSGNQPEP